VPLGSIVTIGVLGGFGKGFILLSILLMASFQSKLPML
jgi:hypothetical protein